EAHQQRFGFVSPEKELIVEAAQVEVIAKGDASPDQTVQHTDKRSGQPVYEGPVRMAGESRQSRFFQRDDLIPEQLVTGPAVIIEPNSTIVIEPGWRAQLREDDTIVLERYLPLPKRVAVGTEVDPVMLEIFNNLFMNVAEQMGSVLQNTAVSVNIKERLDFSCAIFDPHGDLIANAPHMPVHLGSMSESIKTVIRENAASMQPGDAYVLNAPYNGGTHLPDITVIKPVFDAAGERVIFYVASRGHHADIGGMTPGSAPADSTTVEQEGVLIDNFKLVARGRFLESEMRTLLASGPYPARNPDYN
ncbi:MAG: hydantoinase B/oxoprolinase family protein, partial [Candidatus Competibacteraceae bacterium]|nr:hydantoinase B/oxoprolinase family protein [Candidatus Competibacteraceae bacterium]